MADMAEATITTQQRRSAHIDTAAVVLVGVFVAFRLAATLGSSIEVSPDSVTYFEFRFWGGMRMPLIAGIYTVLDEPRLIVTVQAFFGAGCWAAAAVVAGGVLRSRRARFVFQGGLLLFGLTEAVTNWDNALLSESVSISLAVLAGALAIRVAATPTVAWTVGLVVAGAAWGWTRPNNAMVLAMAAVVLFVLGANRRRLFWPAAGVLLVVSILGVGYARSNETVQTMNLAQVAVRYVVRDATVLAWFEAEGMPDPSGVLTGPADMGAWTEQLLADPEFEEWFREDGASTWGRYLASHPDAVARAASGRNVLHGFANGATVNGEARPVVPGVVERLVWPDTLNAGPLLVLVLAVAAVAVPVGLRRSGLFAPVVAASALVWVSLVNVVVVSVTAGSEYGRLLTASSVTAKVGALFLLAAALDSLAAKKPAR